MDIVTYAALKKQMNNQPQEGDGLFLVPFTLDASGFALDGVTYAEIMSAYNEGKRIVCKGYVSSAANLGFSGSFELPLAYFNDDSVFILTLISGQTTCEAWIKSDNTITVYIKNLLSFDNKTKGVSDVTVIASNDTWVSAKLLYDYVDFALANHGLI